MAAYDVLDKGLDWVIPDGTPEGKARREEPGATGVTDLIEADIPGLVKDGLIRKSEGKAQRAKGKEQGAKGKGQKAGGKKR